MIIKFCLDLLSARTLDINIKNSFRIFERKIYGPIFDSAM